MVVVVVVVVVVSSSSSLLCKASSTTTGNALGKPTILYAWRCLQSKQGQNLAKNPRKTTFYTSCRILPLLNMQQHDVKRRNLDVERCLQSKQGQKTSKKPMWNNHLYIMSYTSLALLAKQAKFDENKQKHEVKQRDLDAERCLQSKQGQKPAKNPCETTIFTSCRIRPLFCLQNKQNSRKTSKNTR